MSARPGAHQAPKNCWVHLNKQTSGWCCHWFISASNPRRIKRLRCRAEAPRSGKGLSYKDAGVDINAGNELVRRIQKLNPSIGGFSGMVPFGALCLPCLSVTTSLKCTCRVSKVKAMAVRVVHAR